MPTVNKQRNIIVRGPSKLRSHVVNSRCRPARKPAGFELRNLISGHRGDQQRIHALEAQMLATPGH